MCGLYSLIEKNFKKKCDLMAVSKIPAVYEFLPFIDRVKSLEDFDKSREYDVVITVDVAAIERICSGKILFDKAFKTINFDHHATNCSYADINIINPAASSTSEVILDTAQALGWELDYNAALNLYNGILTDTGSFRFENTKPSTLIHAAKLVELGVSPSDVYKKVYESDTKTIVLFQAHCISRAKFSDNDKIAYTVVYQKDMEKFNAGEEAMEGLTEKLRAIVTTQTAFVVKEMKSGISKVSMRSKQADVSKICAVFGGGGHKFAAGCMIKAAPDEAVKKVLEEIRSE
jgi:phosphoesterase RecJ-like protein